MDEQIAVWLSSDEIIEITDSLQWIAEDEDEEVQENNKDLINAYHKLQKQLKDYYEARATHINKSATK
jgi:predicted transcriptional regulator